MRTRGFTLVELMISMALFGLIAAGAMSLVMSAARSQAHSARVDLAQTSLRAGIDFITRDVLMASAGATTGQVTIPGGTLVNAIDLTGNAYSGTSDKLELYLVDGTVAAQVPAAVAGGATTLTVTYEKSTGVFAAMTTPYPSNIQVSDLRNAAITTLTAVSGTTLTIGALPGSGFTAPPPSIYVMPSKHVIYTIGTPFSNGGLATANTSALMMSINGAAAQPLAEGVEDMQIAYGFDDNLDGVLTDNGTVGDEWLYNNSGDLASAHAIANLRAIRITLVAKSTSVDSGAVFPVAPASEDRPAGTTTDGFVRRVLRTEIAVRSFNLNQ